MTDHDSTLFPALLTPDGTVHKHQGGGPGLRDDQGRPIYIAGLAWCVDEPIAGVPVDQPITCQRCLDEHAAHQREISSPAPGGRPAGGGG